jgi:hypothetical protein
MKKRRRQLDLLYKHSGLNVVYAVFCDVRVRLVADGLYHRRIYKLPCQKGTELSEWYEQYFWTRTNEVRGKQCWLHYELWSSKVSEDGAFNT